MRRKRFTQAVAARDVRRCETGLARPTSELREVRIEKDNLRTNTAVALASIESKARLVKVENSSELIRWDDKITVIISVRKSELLQELLPVIEP